MSRYVWENQQVPAEKSVLGRCQAPILLDRKDSFAGAGGRLEGSFPRDNLANESVASRSAGHRGTLECHHRLGCG